MRMFMYKDVTNTTKRSFNIYLRSLHGKLHRLKYLYDKLKTVEEIGGVSGVFDINGGALPILIGYRIRSEGF